MPSRSAWPRLLFAAAALALISATACSSNDGASDAAATSSDGAATPSGTLAMLTYNVAGLPEGISQSHPEANSPVIGALLGDYDVVLTQEDFGFYTDALRAEASLQHLTVPHAGPEQENPLDRQGVLTGDGLNIMASLPIEEQPDRVPWTECGDDAADCLALKGFARTTLTLADGVTVDLYNLHNEAGGDDDALRADDLDQLVAYLDDNSADRPVIIGGDWNLHTDEEPDATQFQDFLAETGLTDTCDVVDCGDDTHIIDKIVFRSSDDLTLTPTRHEFERERFVDDSGEPLSDHDPLRVDFDWSA
ncbi:MAG: hypothetical protein R2754_17315 [Microthrixaceae bacterium]